MSKTIVTVWHDESSDSTPAWIVDRDDGMTTSTVKVFAGDDAGRKAANQFASEYAKEKGLQVRTNNR